MSTKPFTLNILTPDRMAYEGQVTSVIAPSTQGAIGVWADHAPLVSALAGGSLRYQPAGGSWQSLQVGPGVLEMARNTLTLLLESVEGESAAVAGPYA
ncbi:MAG: F0F1 ATP synthase subunit epsilon [Candidatus Omnitrophica bacterium]|nr:F0F1 ATP synthase subunit epsilon [Candidatus Omnitrophota bacterium]